MVLHQCQPILFSSPHILYVLHFHCFRPVFFSITFPYLAATQYLPSSIYSTPSSGLSYSPVSVFCFSTRMKTARLEKNFLQHPAKHLKFPSLSLQRRYLFTAVSSGLDGFFTDWKDKLCKQVQLTKKLQPFSVISFQRDRQFFFQKKKTLHRIVSSYHGIKAEDFDQKQGLRKYDII